MSFWNAIKELFTGPRIQTQFEQLLLEEEARKVTEEPQKEEVVAKAKKPAAKPAAKPAKGAKAAAKPADKTKAKKKK